MTAPWPVEIEARGPVATGALLYRRGGELRLGLVVKVTFEIRPGEAMPVLAPEPVVRDDAPASADPAAPLFLASELSPPLPGAEVLLSGFAYAQAGALVTRSSVRLAVKRDRPAVDKELFVYGERAPAGTLVPFARVSLGPERGPGALIDPLDPRRLATFGPLGPAAPERGGVVGAALAAARAAAVLELPDDFDAVLLHAAPLDQRFAALFGDERVRLEGMHPLHRKLDAELPGVRAVATVRAPTAISEGDRRAINLRADTLRIDAERLRAFVLWRGSFPVPSEAALRALKVEASLAADPAPWRDGPQSNRR